MMRFDRGVGLETVTVKCGTDADITNVETASNSPANTPITDFTFSNLDNGCYGKNDGEFTEIAICYSC